MRIFLVIICCWRLLHSHKRASPVAWKRIVQQSGQRIAHRPENALRDFAKIA